MAYVAYFEIIFLEVITMKFKHTFKLILLLACLMIISLFAGCGGGGSDGYGLVGTWIRGNDEATFSGGTSGTFTFRSSTGIYDETGSYVINDDMQLSITGVESPMTFDAVSYEEIKSGVTGWCIANDVLYLGSTSNAFTRK